MNNQNSKCCNAPVMVSSGDEGTSCYVCRHCMRATDIAYPTTSKGEEKTGKGLVKCDRCRQIKPIGLVLENITDVNCGKGLCIDCSKDAYDFTHMRSSPNPRLENWKEDLAMFILNLNTNKEEDGTNAWINLSMEAKLKSFISTLLQEEWERILELAKECYEDVGDGGDPYVAQRNIGVAMVIGKIQQ